MTISHQNWNPSLNTSITAGDLRRLAINKAVKNFTKRLNACVKAGCGYFEFSVTGKLFVFVAQTWCAFRSAHILLHVNVRNDAMVTEQ